MRADVHRLLCDIKDQPVCLFKNPGNAGDALIQAATVAALDRADVRWESVDHGDDVGGRTLLIGGGGNLTPYYDQVELALRGFLENEPRRIIILPHGIRGQSGVLGLLREQDLVVCRDLVSYDHVRTSTIAEVALAHDMAFHLDAWEFLNDQALARVARPFLDERLAACGWSTGQLRRRRVMLFMRTDNESLPYSPETDIDISVQLIDDGVNNVSATSAWSLLECVRRSRAVVTDRLHVAISAALLGVPTEFWPNSYDKNRSAFDHSLCRFPHVRLVGAYERRLSFFSP